MLAVVSCATQQLEYIESNVLLNYFIINYFTILCFVAQVI